MIFKAAKEVEEALAKEAAEAYAAGWRACLKAVLEAATELSSEECVRKALVLEGGKLPRSQTAQWFLLEVLKNNPVGLSTRMLLEAPKVIGCAASLASLRVALSRLNHRKLVFQTPHGWFLSETVLSA